MSADLSRERKNGPVAALTDDDRLKLSCRAKSGVYLRRGKITRKPCEACGSEKSQMHHHDYTKPLDVTWLCRKCHITEHGKVPGGKKTCSRCGDPQAPGSYYCRLHKQEYDRAWRAKRAEEFAAFRAAQKDG